MMLFQWKVYPARVMSRYQVSQHFKQLLQRLNDALALIDPPQHHREEWSKLRRHIRRILATETGLIEFIRDIVSILDDAVKLNDTTSNHIAWEMFTEQVIQSMPALVACVYQWMDTFHELDALPRLKPFWAEMIRVYRPQTMGDALSVLHAILKMLNGDPSYVVTPQPSARRVMLTQLTTAPTRTAEEAEQAYDRVYQEHVHRVLQPRDDEDDPSEPPSPLMDSPPQTPDGLPPFPPPRASTAPAASAGMEPIAPEPLAIRGLSIIPPLPPPAAVARFNLAHQELRNPRRDYLHALRRYDQRELRERRRRMRIRESQQRRAASFARAQEIDLETDPATAPVGYRSFRRQSMGFRLRPK